MEINNRSPSYPHPFKVIDGCLFKEVRTKNGSYDQKLCNFLPYIVSEVTLDDGAEESKRLVLGGVRQDGSLLPEIEVTGSDLGAFNWLIDKWGADCVLEIGPNIRDSVRYAIQMTAPDAERQTVYEVTGWKKIGGGWRFLMPGGADLTVRLPGKLGRYAFPTEASPEALSILPCLLANPPAPKEVILPLLACTFLSPLNCFLRMGDCEPKFMLLFLGRTGTGKSTLSSFFLSFFGHFTQSDLPISFRDTKNSIGECCAMLNDVLTCVDDFHPSSRKEEQELAEKAQMLARAYGDRVGRGRLRADATLMPARPPRGNAILTAELPPEIGESGLARCFSIELHPGDFDMGAYKFFEDASRQGLLQSCMLLFTTWLREKFLAMRKRRRSSSLICAESLKTTGRTSAAVASAVTAACPRSLRGFGWVWRCSSCFFRSRISSRWGRRKHTARSMSPCCMRWHRSRRRALSRTSPRTSSCESSTRSSRAARYRSSRKAIRIRA